MRIVPPEYYSVNSQHWRGSAFVSNQTLTQAGRLCKKNGLWVCFAVFTVKCIKMYFLFFLLLKVNLGRFSKFGNSNIPTSVDSKFMQITTQHPPSKYWTTIKLFGYSHVHLQSCKVIFQRNQSVPNLIWRQIDDFKTKPMCQSGELAWAGQLNFLNKVLLKELYTFHLLLPLYMQGSLNPCQLDLNSNLIQFNLMFKSETFTHHLPLPLSVQGFLSLRFTTSLQNFPMLPATTAHPQRMSATKERFVSI